MLPRYPHECHPRPPAALEPSSFGPRLPKPLARRASLHRDRRKSVLENRTFRCKKSGAQYHRQDLTSCWTHVRRLCRRRLCRRTLIANAHHCRCILSHRRAAPHAIACPGDPPICSLNHNRWESTTSLQRWKSATPIPSTEYPFSATRTLTRVSLVRVRLHSARIARSLGQSCSLCPRRWDSAICSQPSESTTPSPPTICLPSTPRIHRPATLECAQPHPLSIARSLSPPSSLTSIRWESATYRLLQLS